MVWWWFTSIWSFYLYIVNYMREHGPEMSAYCYFIFLLQKILRKNTLAGYYSVTLIFE